MKRLSLALVFALSACGMQPAMADTKAEAMAYMDQLMTSAPKTETMETGYNSPECIFTAEADEPEVRAFAVETIVPHIDKNRAMTFEDYSFKDTLIAIQMVVCEGKTPQQAVEFVDPD